MATDRFAMIREATLKIAAGGLVDLADASYVRDGVCIGDFREVGWSKKVVTRSSMCWEWNGPHPVRVNGEIIKPGCHTEEIEMDWS